MTSANQATDNSIRKLDELPQDFWMGLEEQVRELIYMRRVLVRPCEIYQDEYRECRSMRSKLQRYFVHGKSIRDTSMCEQWKKDHDTCIEFRKFQTSELAGKLIQSEKERKQERLKHSRGNNVWEYRTEPPQDWNKPLPEYLEKMKLPNVDWQSEQNRCVIS